MCSVALLLLVGALCLVSVTEAGSFNYAEALQKAIYFYECQVRCG